MTVQEQVQAIRAALMFARAVGYNDDEVLPALDSLVAYVERLENQISEATEAVAVVEAEVMHDAILDALDFSTGWSRPMADRERLDHITKLLTAALPASTTAPLAPPKESL